MDIGPRKERQFLVGRAWGGVNSGSGDQTVNRDLRIRRSSIGGGGYIDK